MFFSVVHLRVIWFLLCGLIGAVDGHARGHIDANVLLQKAKAETIRRHSSYMDEAAGTVLKVAEAKLRHFVASAASNSTLDRQENRTHPLLLAVSKNLQSLEGLVDRVMAKRIIDPKNLSLCNTWCQVGLWAGFLTFISGMILNVEPGSFLCSLYGVFLYGTGFGVLGHGNGTSDEKNRTEKNVDVDTKYSDADITDAMYQLASTIGYGTYNPKAKGSSLALWHGLMGVLLPATFYPMNTDLWEELWGQIEKRIMKMVQKIPGSPGILFTRPFRTLVRLGVGLVLGMVSFKEAPDHGAKTWEDAFYLTLMTASTVGYGDLSPLNVTARTMSFFLYPFLNSVYNDLNSNLGGGTLEAHESKEVLKGQMQCMKDNLLYSKRVLRITFEKCDMVKEAVNNKGGEQGFKLGQQVAEKLGGILVTAWFKINDANCELRIDGVSPNTGFEQINTAFFGGKNPEEGDKDYEEAKEAVAGKLCLEEIGCYDPKKLEIEWVSCRWASSSNDPLCKNWKE